LGADGKCTVQSVKAKDCMAFPYQATIEADGNISATLDSICPAGEFLDEKFKAEASALAVECAKQFHPDTYQDWMNNYWSWL
jgi:hypothetical protein